MDINGGELTFNPSSPQPAPATKIDAFDTIAVSCSSTTSCMAVDVDGQAVMFGPATPGDRQVGAKLEDGLREGPSWIAFVRDNGPDYHTYTVMAPDPFVAPYHAFLLKRTPKGDAMDFRAWRKDEYPAAPDHPSAQAGRRCWTGPH